MSIDKSQTDSGKHSSVKHTDLIRNENTVIALGFYLLRGKLLLHETSVMGISGGNFKG